MKYEFGARDNSTLVRSRPHNRRGARRSCSLHSRSERAPAFCAKRGLANKTRGLQFYTGHARSIAIAHKCYTVLSVGGRVTDCIDVLPFICLSDRSSVE